MLAVTRDAPIHIEKSLKDLESAAVFIQKFSSDEDQIIGDVCNSVADMLPLVTKLSEMTAHIRELEKYSRYLSCIAHIEDLRCVVMFYFIDVIIYFIHIFYYTSRTRSTKRKYNNYTKINTKNYKWKNLVPS